MSRFSEVLHGGPVNAEEIGRVRSVIMFEEPDLQARLVRFGALLVMASAIATFGLYADSVATVIGAMIVAPLMLPIMGLAFGIAIGDRKAIWTSLLVGVSGMATAIAVGYLISFMMPSAFDPTSNTQIMARTAPRLVDLMAALATGLAGAFAISRSDVSDTLPGVAIAISLVPPLANVGILLGSNRPDLAAGSLLLFVTNYLAILLTGSFVFGIMGYPKAALEGKTPRIKHAAIAIVVVMVMIVAVPLGVTSFQVLTGHAAEAGVAERTKAWLEGTRLPVRLGDYRPRQRRGDRRRPGQAARARSTSVELEGEYVWACRTSRGCSVRCDRDRAPVADERETGYEVEKPPAASTIDEYIAGFPPETQAKLEEIRALIAATAPEATETISYAIPTFDLEGKHLVHFAGFAKHVGFYPIPTGMEAFKEELSAYKTGKGSVQFPLTDPLPVDLIRRVVEFRVTEVERKTK